MTYAQIKSGLVVNIIALDDSSLEPIFVQGFDYLINLTGMDPQPGIGWGYDGTNFTPPV